MNLKVLDFLKSCAWHPRTSDDETTTLFRRPTVISVDLASYYFSVMGSFLHPLHPPHSHTTDMPRVACLIDLHETRF